MAQPVRLLDQVRDQIRLLHYSYRTEQQYVGWIRRFILFHARRHPREMGGPEVEAFLTNLAVDRNVAASTQSQALGALLFLYRKVLKQDLPWLRGVVRAKKPVRVPTVLSRNEIRALLAELDGVYHLIALLLYGSGLRLLEALRLRVQDVDFDGLQITVRSGKGGKDRVTVLPESVVPTLRLHLEQVRGRHEIALREGFGGAITSTKMPSSGKSRTHCGVLAFIGLHRVTRFGIPSQPSYWNRVSTYELSNRSSATRMSRQHKFTRM